MLSQTFLFIYNRMVLDQAQRNVPCNFSQCSVKKGKAVRNWNFTAQPETGIQ